MKLVGSRTSPFVRKARVILAETNRPFEFLEASAWDAGSPVPKYNPLNKVPALVLDDGTSIYDSVVITEYLDAVTGGAFAPQEPAQRAKVRCQEALGDGIAEAGIAVFLERKREAARQDAGWIERQMGKVDAGIGAVAGALGDKPFLGGERMSLGDIACASALLWLEFRMPEIGWRAAHPKLKAWAERLEARPSFSSTRPA